jgi:hypothetical protein
MMIEEIDFAPAATTERLMRKSNLIRDGNSPTGNNTASKPSLINHSNVNKTKSKQTVGFSNPKRVSEGP